MWRYSRIISWFGYSNISFSIWRLIKRTISVIYIGIVKLKHLSCRNSELLEPERLKRSFLFAVITKLNNMFGSISDSERYPAKRWITHILNIYCCPIFKEILAFENIYIGKKIMILAELEQKLWPPEYCAAILAAILNILICPRVRVSHPIRYVYIDPNHEY